MENKIYKLTDQEFSDLVKSSLNISEVLFKLGYTTKGNSWGYSQVRQRMTDLNLSGKDFRGKSAMITFSEQKKELSYDDLFKENCKHNRNVIRNRIIRDNLLPYKVAICGCKEWQGNTLSLELDHRNGINNDNILENLRFLCPNCHSQTTTYGSRNQKLSESKYDISDDLRNLVISEFLECRNLKAISKKFNIRYKAVQQIISEAGLSKSNQTYVIQYDSNHNELRRFGSIAECCQWLMDNDLVQTKQMKTCRATFNRNVNNFWKNSYWMLVNKK